MDNQHFKGKSVLITGGTGTFGKAFARRLLEEDLCSKVIIFSRDEWKQWDMKQSDPIFNHHKIRYFLGDVRDANRLNRAFNEVHYVIHAAALKQVPAAEYNPSEFIKTNVMGAMNIIDAAVDCRVEKVIALSTDKAVNPVNLYGATKLCADKLFIAGNSYVGARGIPIMSVVRYGNVSGSRGSVLPIWKQLVKENAEFIPITDPNMTRFWITLDETVDFVMQAVKYACGGEIFVPKIPSIKITDLAKAIAPNIPTKICGIRPGEKVHESLLSSEESYHTIELDNQYVITPENVNYVTRKLDMLLDGREGKKAIEGFSYTSDKNSDWLGNEELRKIINKNN